jgi:hypothetical protein
VDAICHARPDHFGRDGLDLVLKQLTTSSAPLGIKQVKVTSCSSTTPTRKREGVKENVNAIFDGKSFQVRLCDRTEGISALMLGSKAICGTLSHFAH